MRKGGTGLVKAKRKGGELQPDGKIVFGRNALGQPICCAHPNSPKGPCQSPFVMPNGRCKAPGHGGNAASGVDNGMFQHGKYSSVLKGDLSANFRALQADKNLISMRDNIALHGARVMELLEQLDQQNDLAKFKDILLSLAIVRSAFRAGESDKVEEGLDKIAMIAEGAIDNDKLWERVSVHMELQRKQAETETKTMALAYKMMTGEEVYYILTTLKSAINEHVVDPQAKSALGKTLRMLNVGAE